MRVLAGHEIQLAKDKKWIPWLFAKILTIGIFLIAWCFNHFDQAHKETWFPVFVGQVAQLFNSFGRFFNVGLWMYRKIWKFEEKFYNYDEYLVISYQTIEYKEQCFTETVVNASVGKQFVGFNCRLNWIISEEFTNYSFGRFDWLVYR